MLLIHGLDGGRVFRGRHTGRFFKRARKIIHGGIRKRLGNFRDIPAVLADQLLCAFDFQAGEKFHRSAAELCGKKLFDNGSAQGKFRTDVVKRDLVLAVSLQIGADFVDFFVVAAGLGQIRDFCRNAPCRG